MALTETAYTRGDTEAMRAAVARILKETPIVDMHTHLYDPGFGDLLLYGIDELLVFHYLVAEAIRAGNMPEERFYGLDKKAQAEFVWNTLFVERSPLSESCRGVLTMLDRLGIDVAGASLNDLRAHFEHVTISDHIDRVFDVCNLESVVMTNDPFDDAERPQWKSNAKRDPRFHAALRLDALLINWDNAYERLRGWGYDVGLSLDAQSAAEVRRFLSDWIARMDPRYVAVSLPPTFSLAADDPAPQLIAECVLPVAREHNLPFAMMIGVKRQVNPALRLAGDAVGKADITQVEHLCARFPDNTFMVTMLSRENQHELCVAARKFRNLFVFGCWWFVNVPSLIEEITRMRFELLGTAFLPQHSDARVLEQVIYKWDHSRAILSKVLSDKYADLMDAGWPVTESAIRRDAQRLLGGNFLEFLGK